jgi:hypothetical protein
LAISDTITTQTTAASILSAVEGRSIALPLDTAAYDALLQRLAAVVT